MLVRINESLIEIDGKARVERGPALKNGIATEDLLSDAKTAPHYGPGKRDALGKPIEIGKPMAYLDWLGDHVWHVYALGDGDRWAKVGSFASEAEAVAHAQSLAAA